MKSPNSNHAREIEILKNFYSALNRNDVPAALALLDPQIERVEFEGTPSGGTFRGLTELKTHIEKGRGTWAEGSCDPERFLDAGDKVLAFVHVRVRLKVKLDWIDGFVTDGFSFKNGKIIQFRSFAEEQQALDWAGIKDSGAS